MSIASYKCDRCGREFPYKGIGFQYYPIEEDTASARQTVYGHLCKGCADSFQRWMGGEEGQKKMTDLVPDGHGGFRWGPAPKEGEE